MRWRVELIVFGASVVAHAGLAFAVVRVEPRELPPPPPIVITVREVEPEPEPVKPEAPKQPEVVEPEVVEPEPEVAEPEPEVAEPEPAPAKPAPAEPAPTPPAEPSAPPEFGLELGGAAGPGGLAVPEGDPDGEPGGKGGGKKVVAQKRKLTPEKAKTETNPGCTETTKAKPLKLAKPTYTDAARAAKLEGAVRLKLQVAADGSVGDVEVLQSLDPDLDQRAIEAAKAATFEPAQACGKPIAASVTLAIRFSL